MHSKGFVYHSPEIFIPHTAKVNASGFNYDTATALLITFVVNNNVDEGENEMAETWEKAFVEFVENYESENIQITYTAEVWRMLCVFVVTLRGRIKGSTHAINAI